MRQIQHEIEEAKKRRGRITIIMALLGLVSGWIYFKDGRCVIVCLVCATVIWIIRSFDVMTWEKIQQPGGKGWRSSDTNSKRKEN